jgi:prophage regulatory protein
MNIKLKFLKLKDVKNLTTLSSSTIYREIASGDFPKQVRIGKNNSVWLESEVMGYLEERISCR